MATFPVYFRAKADGDNKNYPDLVPGTYVYGYYVMSRGHHYILQKYNGGGYDERWECGDWVEVDVLTLEPVDPATDQPYKSVSFCFSEE